MILVHQTLPALDDDKGFSVARHFVIGKVSPRNGYTDLAHIAVARVLKVYDHLTGLYLTLDLGMRPMQVPRLLQELASQVRTWPHFPPPADQGPLTVIDVALAGSAEGHMHQSRAWARQVWDAWAIYHYQVAAFANEYLSIS